ncbi:MAG: NADH-quinone oxidoreductase [Proteobacteria bacterium]|nr:MAG: NADH-quinone oxidoreductase [Pseudomonadota bacterium]
MTYELVLSCIILSVLAISIPLLFIASKKLGPNNKQNLVKNLPYESGVTIPIGNTDARFDIKFYLVAIIFVIFDVELIFLFPWAVNLKTLGMLGIVEMFSFMFLLLSGLIYVYLKRALTWQ